MMVSRRASTYKAEYKSTQEYTNQSKNTRIYTEMKAGKHTEPHTRISDRSDPH